MMKVVLLALVCISFAHVYGTDIEAEIRQALRILNGWKAKAKTVYDAVDNSAIENKKKLNTRADTFVKKYDEFQKETINAVKRASEEFKKIAKEENRPESVIKCITTEEAAAIKAIEERTAKFQGDAKKALAARLAEHNKLEKEFKKIVEDMEAQYKLSVQKIKNCTDSEGIVIALREIFNKYNESYDLVNEIDAKIKNNEQGFEKEITDLSLAADRDIVAAKSRGIEKMKQCLTKTLRLYHNKSMFVLL